MAWREDAKITSLTANRLNVDGVKIPTTATFSIAAGASTVTAVTITLKTAQGVAISNVFPFEVWLSDSAAGAGETGTTASGTPAITTGTQYRILTSKKAWLGACNSSGVAVLTITDAAKTTFYVAVRLPTGVVVSRILATADYGA
jgi:hypothetical protein